MTLSRLTSLILAAFLVAMGFAPPAQAATFYGWNQVFAPADSSDLYSYPSAGDIASNSNGSFIANSGSSIFNDIATDGTTFYGWSTGLPDASSLYSYASASDLANNASGTFHGNTGSGIFNAIATDGLLFYAYSTSGTMYTYASASDLATNSSGVLLGTTAATTFTSIATDGVNFYGWIQQGGDTSVLVQYSSALDMATNTNPTQVGAGGSSIFVGIAAGPETVVPEPASLTLAVLGLVGLGWFGYRRRQK